MWAYASNPLRMTETFKSKWWDKWVSAASDFCDVLFMGPFPTKPCVEGPCTNLGQVIFLGIVLDAIKRAEWCECRVMISTELPLIPYSTSENTFPVLEL